MSCKGGDGRCDYRHFCNNLMLCYRLSLLANVAKY